MHPISAILFGRTPQKTETTMGFSEDSESAPNQDFNNNEPIRKDKGSSTEVGKVSTNV